MKKTLTAALLIFSLAGCSDDDGGGGIDAAAAAADAAATSDAGAGNAVMLASADWTMAAGTEGYWCARATVTEDTYINEFRPIAPQGTHHTALSIDSQGGPDGTFECESSSIGFQILFGSGVGTEPFVLPEGVAFKIPAGSQVLLNLHLYNTTEAPMTGTSGIEVLTMPAAQVVHEAEVVYVMDFGLSVPPGASSQSASCTMNGDTTIFGVFPHMHKLGNHMTGIAKPAGGADIMLIDRAYSFEEQLNYRVDPPVQLLEGDVVTSACGYMNPGASAVGFGDSTDAEMCVLGLYRYPARGGLFVCSN